MKTCNTCSKEKLLSEFNRRIAARDGRQPKCKSCAATYQKANRARANINAKAFRDRHPSEARASVRAWRAANRQTCASIERARYARKLDALVLPFTGQQLEQRLSMASGVCYLCREPLSGEIHVDHVLPLAKGGPHCLSNLRPTHALCNLRKGANKPTK